MTKRIAEWHKKLSDNKAFGLTDDCRRDVMVQFEEKRGIGKKQLAQIVSVATTERFCAIAERVFCRKASATLGVEKQAG